MNCSFAAIRYGKFDTPHRASELPPHLITSTPRRRPCGVRNSMARIETKIRPGSGRHTGGKASIPRGGYTRGSLEPGKRFEGKHSGAGRPAIFLRDAGRFWRPISHVRSGCVLPDDRRVRRREQSGDQQSGERQALRGDRYSAPWRGLAGSPSRSAAEFSAWSRAGTPVPGAKLRWISQSQDGGWESLRPSYQRRSIVDLPPISVRRTLPPADEAGSRDSGTDSVPKPLMPFVSRY